MGRIFSLICGFVISSSIVTLLLAAEGVFSLWPIENQEIYEHPTKESAEHKEETLYNLPLCIPGTSLIAEHLVCYEGPFIEDRTDEPVANVMALVLRNTGKKDIESGTVILKRGEENLTFHFSHVVSGMSVMVLESEGALYQKGGFSAYNGWVNLSEYNSVTLDMLLIEPLDIGAVTVTNLSDTSLENISLLHKNYLPNEIIIGGITYETKISIINPGETIVLHPEHYANGYSLIFKAEE